MKNEIIKRLKFYFLNVARKKVMKGKLTKRQNDILFYIVNKLYAMERGGKNE